MLNVLEFPSIQNIDTLMIKNLSSLTDLDFSTGLKETKNSEIKETGVKGVLILKGMSPISLPSLLTISKNLVASENSISSFTLQSLRSVTEQTCGSANITGSFSDLEIPKLNEIKGGINVQTKSERFNFEVVGKLKNEGDTTVCLSGNKETKSVVTQGTMTNTSATANQTLHNNDGVIQFETTTDGTAVIRLQQRLPNNQCAESRIIMRYILPNGILVSNDIDFNFDPINFCPVDKIEIHPLIGNFILVLYLNSTNPGSTGNNILVQYAAMIINQDGKVIQNPPFMSNTSVKTKTVSNSNGDFLWTFKPDNNDSITYAKFTLQ
ncbi:12302_t:CDS:2 [Gigaspora margarita]|uniref:12302_t:CDS:1 n=1 Tax=Gigaspora margarita TaxID=4874 RepID=A0ABN7UX20_GIGMA|nr:12302_t:CDS:2 [Gigaspora margarita]